MQEKASKFEPFFALPYHASEILRTWEPPSSQEVRAAATSVMRVLSPPVCQYTYGYSDQPASFSCIRNDTCYSFARSNPRIVLESCAVDRKPATVHQSKEMAGHPSNISIDDGSVASKLLQFNAKTTSSFSVELLKSKDIVRESPYQKSMKVKQMKLQHCAEALGMESFDAPSSFNRTIDEYSRCTELAVVDDRLSSLVEAAPKVSRQQPLVISVTSRIPLDNAAIEKNATYRYPRNTKRNASFPPPLSHLLPSSSSTDSLCCSLRPSRRDGRFILRKVTVPCTNYLYANRRNGRLTLHAFSSDELVNEENVDSEQQRQQRSIANGELRESAVLHVKKKKVMQERIRITQELNHRNADQRCLHDEIIKQHRGCNLYGIPDRSFKASVNTVMHDITRNLRGLHILSAIAEDSSVQGVECISRRCGVEYLSAVEVASHHFLTYGNLHSREVWSSVTDRNWNNKMAADIFATISYEILAKRSVYLHPHRARSKITPALLLYASNFFLQSMECVAKEWSLSPRKVSKSVPRVALMAGLKSVFQCESAESIFVKERLAALGVRLMMILSHEYVKTRKHDDECSIYRKKAETCFPNTGYSRVIESTDVCADNLHSSSCKNQLRKNVIKACSPSAAEIEYIKKYGATEVIDSCLVSDINDGRTANVEGLRSVKKVSISLHPVSSPLGLLAFLPPAQLPPATLPFSHTDEWLQILHSKDRCEYSESSSIDFIKPQCIATRS
ncbi:hypothetical protein KP509_26G016300 [Ceratopteris richardii]|uniref:FAF domain-containing protein n=1 Tax=Ceratopteris richardii TaxID=49495 RepID=A0A8T2RL69_CERRI|nr:hypothetical protein KP509_26G016300 [Ceratopteris richardii]